MAVIEVPVLLQFVTDATTPANLTVLVPCVEPKLLPVITTEVPVAPEVGFKLEMTGAAQREPLEMMAREMKSLRTERKEQRIAIPLDTAMRFHSTLEAQLVTAAQARVEIVGKLSRRERTRRLAPDECRET
jgi:hypothetical protein